jgi:hypothetical protein
MTTLRWLAPLLAKVPVLAEDDLRQSREWAADAEEYPVTVRLGDIANSYVAHYSDLTDEERTNLFAGIEEVMRTGDDLDLTAVATGFLEALLSAGESGFALEPTWNQLGPKAENTAWNGIPSLA